jgi:transposase
MQPEEKRRRRRHTPAFKAAAVAACLRPGASVAAVALDLRLNANMLRCWIKRAAETASAPKALPAPDISARTPAFVPVKIDAPPDPRPERTLPTEQPIRVHLRKGGSWITIEWPVAAAASCAVWLRELVG